MTTETPADPMAAVADAISGLGATLTERLAAQEASIRALIDERVPVTPPADPPQRDANLLPGGQRASATDRVTDPWTGQWVRDYYSHLSEADQRRQVRANFELCTMLAAGAGRMHKPVDIVFPEAFQAAARYNMFEDRTREPLRVLRSVEHEDRHARAMDTQETGYGLELIGAEYVSQLWQAARNLDTIVGDIRTIPMNAPTTYVPIDGNVPEMLFVPESTTAGASAYTSSKTPSNRITLTAKKFTIQQRWSGEMEEDSIIAFVPFLRDMLAQSTALHLGSAYYNGDDTNAGTGNINTDDADPADSKHFLAWDGIRHYWLVDATGQGKNMAASLDPREINVARGKLNGGDDDVDNALTNINWGLNPRNLRNVMDWDTYMAMLDADKVTTVDKYGPAATVLTGELGSYAGIPIISPPYASKTEADGKASTTEASNTKGQISVFAPAGFLGGMRRNVQLFVERVQGTDQMLIELYTRRAFKRFGGNVAAGVYNISL